MMATELRKSRFGEGGIRTLDAIADMPLFESGAFNHSATSPYSMTIKFYIDLTN
jgi:hypothetical protein